MFEMIHGKSNYISCIKINGEPILPPLMTPERYNEMQKYKEQAKLVEFRIAQKKKAKESLLPTNNLIQNKHTINDKYHTVPLQETDCDTIKDLNKYETNNPVQDDLPSKEHNTEIEKYNHLLQRSKIVPNTYFHPSISRDIQCNDSLCASVFKNHFQLNNQSNVEKVIDLSVTNVQCSLKSESYVIEKTSFSEITPEIFPENPNNKEPDLCTDKHNEISKIDNNEHATNTETDKPRLIRQNSYTLDTPSPLLRALMETNSSTSTLNTSENSKDKSKDYSSDQCNSTERSKRRSCWDLTSAREKWSSFESNIDLVFIPAKVNIKNVKPRIFQSKSSSLPPSPSPSPTKHLLEKDYTSCKTITRNISSAASEQRATKKGIVKKAVNVSNEKETSTPTSYVSSITNNSMCKPSDKINNVDDKTKKLPVNSIIHSDKCDNKTNGTSTKNIIIETSEKHTSDIISDDTLPKDCTVAVNFTPESLFLNNLVNSNQAKLNSLISNEQKIREIYAAIQKEHSKRMTELILRQKKEQEMLIKQLKLQETFFIEQIKKNCLNIQINNNMDCERPISTLNDNFNSSNVSHNGKNDNIFVADVESELDDMSSQTIQMSPVDDNLTINSSIDNNYIRIRSTSETSYLDTMGRNESSFIDYQNEDDNTRTQYKIPTKLQINNYTNISNIENCNIQNTIIYNRQQLFYKENPKEQNHQFVTAVITIQAYIRGYLVRRLLQTERVCTLIQTVKDTLLCALEFHNDNTDDIQPADIELHRRLIQQLTAACYAIHDIFFKLSTKEKMTIINLDRQRIQEKLLRPSSAKSSPILSSTTQKIIQRKLQRSNPSTPSPNVEKSIRTCKIISENNQKLGTTTITSLLSSPLIKTRRLPNQIQNKKPWR